MADFCAALVANQAFVAHLHPERIEKTNGK
jgi:hypothetical protein